MRLPHLTQLLLFRNKTQGITTISIMAIIIFMAIILEYLDTSSVELLQDQSLTAYLSKKTLGGLRILRCKQHEVLIVIQVDALIYVLSRLNLTFMLVQFFYGFVSGSLGLLTDSIHMLFDCAGLAVGLAAAVMSKWPSSGRFPYGYGKVDTISGFANGIFLM